MNRDALNELFDYTTFTWASYGGTLSTLPPAAFARPLEGAGWPSLSNALFHIAAAWDGWLCERAGAGPFVEVDPASFDAWASLHARRMTVRGWLRTVLDAPDDELTAPSQTFGEGAAAFTTSPAAIISHILLHERGHHGDVTTLLSQLGAQVPQTDYLTYEFFRQRRGR